MIEAVLFDLAYTLLNYGDLQPRELFEKGARDSYSYLKGLHTDVPSYEVYLQANLRAYRRGYIWANIRRRDFNAMTVMNRVLKGFGIELHPFETRALAWRWYRPVLKQTSVDAKTPATLRKLADAGIKMAIVSNTCVPGHCLDRHLEREHLLAYFPVRVYSSETTIRKPHPEIFHLALRQLNVAPSHAVFVGDLPAKDIRGARRAGMQSVWKAPADHVPRQKNHHGADFVIRSICELPTTLASILPHGLALAQ